MARLYDTYRFVKVVRKLGEKEEKELNANVIAPNATYIMGKPLVADVRNMYRKRRFRRNRSRKKVQLISGLATQEDYLKVGVSIDTDIQGTVYQIDTKGWELLERSLFKILPKGLLLAWADKNGKFHNFIFGLIGGVVAGVPIAIGIIKLLK